MAKILVTGCAGFIGFHVSKMLCEQGHNVVGIDNLNNYYDVELKFGRLAILKKEPAFAFTRLDFTLHNDLCEYFNNNKPGKVIHLGAQAGVRHSLGYPQDYIDNNITGFLNILECCNQYDIKQLLYASSSSVYGHEKEMPFNEAQPCNTPANFYAVTKKCNQGMAYSYYKLYGLKSIGFRFFTAYGTWSRPDMALFLFTKNIIKGKPIDVYNNGNMERDFTYVGDIIEGIKLLMESKKDFSDMHVFNIGCGKPTKLMDFIKEIELKLGKKAIINYMPMQLGDIPKTWCSANSLEEAIGYKPTTTIKEGISKFIDWYVNYYGEK